MSGEVGNPVGRPLDPASEPIEAGGSLPPERSPRALPPDNEPGRRNAYIAATLNRARAKPDASVLGILSRPIKARLGPSSFSPGVAPPPQESAPPPQESAPPSQESAPSPLDSAPLPEVTPNAALGLNVFGANSFKVIELDSSSWGDGKQEILFDAEGAQVPPPREPEQRTPDASLAQALAQTVDRSVTVDVASRHKSKDEDAAPTISSPRIINGLPGSVALVDNRIRYDPGDDYDDLAVGEILAAEIGYRISGGGAKPEEQVLRLFVTMTEDGPEARVAPARKVAESHQEEDLSLEEWVAAASGHEPASALAEPVEESAGEGLADLESLLVQAWQEEWEAPESLHDGLAQESPETPEAEIPDLEVEEEQRGSGIRQALRELIRRAGEKNAEPVPQSQPGDNNDLTEPFGWLLDQGREPEVDEDGPAGENDDPSEPEDENEVQAAEDNARSEAEDNDDATVARPRPSVGAPKPVEDGTGDPLDLSHAGSESDHLAERMRAILGEAEGKR
jgi:hypothetical protein